MTNKYHNDKKLKLEKQPIFGDYIPNMPMYFTEYVPKGRNFKVCSGYPHNYK